MKILHTSDWHLGRVLHGYNLIKDQIYILEQILRIIKEEKIDVLIIAGDIYDKSIPSEAAVDLFNQFLSKVILEEHINTFIIAGNHDSNERIDFGSDLFKHQGLYIVGKCEKGYEKVVLSHDGEEVEFYMLPYIEPAYVRQIAQDEKIKRHDEAMAYLIKQIEAEKRDIPTVLISHAFVAGGEGSDSERRLSVVGGAELVDARHFKAFTYTALGHLHKKQAMGATHIRYSGSPLKYSVSESNQDKGIVIINIEGKDTITIEDKPLIPLRDIRILEGTLERIIEEASQDLRKEDYVYARVMGMPIQDVTAILRQVYPNILGSEWVSSSVRKQGEEGVNEGGTNFLETKERTITEVFMEFLEYVEEDEFTSEDLQYVEKIIKDIEEGKYEA